MGQTLSEPVTSKDSIFGENERLLYGVSGMQGWRISMEDAYAVELGLENPQTKEKLGFFAVFDGHGGERVAQYCGQNMHQLLLKEKSFIEGDYATALTQVFLNTDQAILADEHLQEEPSGCTATAILVTPDNKIYCANAGDSRTVLGIKGVAKPLSFDHKPQNEGEKNRICTAGGFVDFGRVNGNLALSRAIGDFEFKQNQAIPADKQIVTACPDIVEHILTVEDEFVVLACDGIWDCKSSQEVIEFVRRGVAAKSSLDKIAENLMDNCISTTAETGGIGCDNMTVIIVALLHEKTKDEWYDMVRERVAQGDGPVAPPSYAEMKGPGFHHGQSNEHAMGGDDLDDDEENVNDEGIVQNYDESKQVYEQGAGPSPGLSRNKEGRKRGDIVVLPDGTEILADADEIISMGSSFRMAVQSVDQNSEADMSAGDSGERNQDEGKDMETK